MRESRSKSLLVSVLTLGKPDNIIRLLNVLPGWLADFVAETEISTQIVIRNNDPNVSFKEVNKAVQDCTLKYPEVKITLLTGQANTGFGRGHNENYRLAPSDFLVILNDDIGLPNISWLKEGISRLEANERLAFIGHAGNPQDISPFFANGTHPHAFHIETLKYVEASVMLLKGRAFSEIGMFDEGLEWAMGEDADLSLRAQQHGYKLDWMPMPHEHWRSTSFNALPGVVKYSIMEHNRGKLFSTWRHTLATGRIGQFEVFDLWGDGMGDLFCSLPHLHAEFSRYPALRRSRILINTSQPDLIQLLGIPEARVTGFADIGALRQSLGADEITTLKTTREINYSLPFNMHTLVCGALGVAHATADEIEDFGALLRAAAPTEHVLKGVEPRSYCVVHLEFAREGHAGRAISPDMADELLQICAEHFDTLVLIGKQRRLGLAKSKRGTGKVVDLQGKLSLSQLIAVTANARFFVGIDSFPAHVAQASGVRSSVFFGSVHPLARVWNTQKVWPLVAGLECIGCYHTHLEPSVPFCMRRDEACVREIGPDHMRSIIKLMVDGLPYEWSRLEARFRALQGKLLTLMRFHPAPPERLFRRHVANNEQVSNLIYQMTDMVAGLLRDEYQTATVAKLASRISDLEAQSFAREIELQRLQRERDQLQSAKVLEMLTPQGPEIKVVQLSELAFVAERCQAELDGEWLRIESTEEDPVLLLPAIHGHGSKIHLRLVYASETSDYLEVFWAVPPAGFSENDKQRVRTSNTTASLNRTFDVAEGQTLLLRIDPLKGAGSIKIRGSIGGIFSLEEPEDELPEGEVIEEQDAPVVAEP